MSPLLDMQMRFRELGRIRSGEKGAKGEPKKRTTWRLTSASKRLLESAQAVYGGELREWTGAPSEGYWELLTDTAELDVMIPPVTDAGTLLSQHYELWSGGGCKRRCDGVTQETGAACACKPEARECKPTTRLSVMLPRVPDIGVWRLDSLGVNAAVELPGTFGLLVQAANGNFLPASLRLEQRVSKKEGEPTRRFVVPVLEMPYAGVGELADAAASGKPMLLGASYASGKPALPPAAAPPAGRAFENGEKPAFGERPPLPTLDSSGEGAVSHAEAEGPRSPTPAAGGPDAQVPESGAPSPGPSITAPQAKKLNVLVGQLRDAGRITTEQLYVALGRVSYTQEGEKDFIDYVSEDGELHWSPLRDTLSKDEATGLIDRLEKFAANLEAAA